MRLFGRRAAAVKVGSLARMVICVAGTCGLGAGCASAQADAPPASTLSAGDLQGLSVQAGVFAPAQSRRGEEAYMDTCKRCHQRDLMGDFVEDSPPLVGEEFMDEWGQWTVGDLFEFLTTEMPPKPKDRRGVTAQNYADIIAFILEQNGFPAGEKELPAEFEPLSLIEMSP